MIKLEIESINNYIYILKDEKDKKYIFNLEFIGLAESVEVGNYIYINEKLLDSNYEGYSKAYTFGNIDSEYGKLNVSKEDVDVVKVIIDDKEIYLKRLYG